MNWIDETYRPWWAEHGKTAEAPEAPDCAPNLWVTRIYKPWRATMPKDNAAPASPW